MKRLKINKYLVVVFIPVLAVMVSASSNKIDTIDLNNARGDVYTRFIENIEWPSDEVIKNKAIATGSIPKDVQEFKDYIKTFFKPDYRPSDEYIDANLIAIPSLRNNNDYILLKYRENGFDIQIEDEKAIFVLISPSQDSILKTDDIKEYVKGISKMILDIPETGYSKIGVSKLDIGNSKCGLLLYESNYPPPDHWYTALRWWSDNKNVMFLIPKGIVDGKIDGEDQRKIPHPARDVMAPRKFKK
jgi:hypothetical protein